MATLRSRASELVWPVELETFDPQAWECRAAWHLARARAAPNKSIALTEIRASMGIGAVGDRDGVVFVGPPA